MDSAVKVKIMVTKLIKEVRYLFYLLWEINHLMNYLEDEMIPIFQGMTIKQKKNYTRWRYWMLFSDSQLHLKTLEAPTTDLVSQSAPNLFNLDLGFSSLVTYRLYLEGGSYEYGLKIYFPGDSAH